MPDWKQHPTIASGPRKAGRPLGSVPSNKLPSQLPEMTGLLFGRLKVVSGEIVRKKEKGKAHLLTECTGCGARSLKEYTSLTKGSAGCRACGNPRAAPKWLVMRGIAAKQRCTNPNDKNYKRYGARGIEFRFQSPTHYAVWVQENLGLHKEMQIDRIENDGHYEPGNLRYLTLKQNMNNQRGKQATRRMHKFRESYPDVKYADSTLVHLIREGLTDEQIVERFKRPSFKPKGVYGTFSTPDPDILSLSKDS